MVIVEANMKMLILPEFLSFPLTFHFAISIT